MRIEGIELKKKEEEEEEERKRWKDDEERLGNRETAGGLERPLS